MSDKYAAPSPRHYVYTVLICFATYVLRECNCCQECLQWQPYFKVKRSALLCCTAVVGQRPGWILFAGVCVFSSPVCLNFGQKKAL